MQIQFSFFLNGMSDFAKKKKDFFSEKLLNIFYKIDSLKRRQKTKGSKKENG